MNEVPAWSFLVLHVAYPQLVTHSSIRQLMKQAWLDHLWIVFTETRFTTKTQLKPVLMQNVDSNR